MSKRVRHLAMTIFVVLAAPGVAMASGRPYAGDLGQAIAALLIFVGLLLILGKFAWAPVVAQLRRREEDIAMRKKHAADNQQEAEELVKEYQDRLDQVDDEAEKLLLSATRDAAIESDRILSAARGEARKIVSRADEDIDIARSQAQKNLQAQAASLAAEIAGQVLRKNISPEDHRRLLADATEQLDASTGDKS